MTVILANGESTLEHRLQGPIIDKEVGLCEGSKASESPEDWRCSQREREC